MTSQAAPATDATDVTEAPEARDATTTSPDPLDRGLPRTPSRRLARVIAIVIVLLCAVAFFFPVAAAPLNADDRYWYMWVGWRADGSVLEVFSWSWERLPHVLGMGRMNTLTQLERRLVCLPVIELAVATATPIVVYQAVVKLLLAAGSLLAGLAMVRSLRWRDTAGRLVRVERRPLLLAGIAGAVAIGVGAQAAAQTRNGWTAYPVNTYSSALFIFGSVALILWLTRRVADGSRRTAVVAAVVLVFLALITALSYELALAAIPVAAVALILVPVTDASRQRAGRRAKLVTGTAYLGTFAVAFVAIRIVIARICANVECYSGVEVDLGRGAIRTIAYNIISPIPGFGGNELRTDMRRAGLSDLYPVGPTAWSMVLGIAVIVALVVVWQTVGGVPTQAGTAENGPTREADRRTQAILLGIGAGLFLLAALGTAAVVGVSVRAHNEITEPGTLYRNAMVTWTGYALCAVFAVLALSYLLPKAGGMVAWITLATTIGLIGALTLPGNLMALRANRINYQITEAINWEVVKGDLEPGSDARRCELFEQAKGVLFPGAWRRTVENANLAFVHYHGRTFCSDPTYPGGPGWTPTFQVR